MNLDGIHGGGIYPYLTYNLLCQDIDPYDPSTMGFTEIGYVLGSHGLRGELKVKCLSDFGELRLCRHGERFMRPPNRRWPRAVELLSGRRYILL